MKVYSWNVNGLRAILNKGFLEWVRVTQPDILCLQETKAQEDQIPTEIRKLNGYSSFWHSAQRKGYSGVGVLTKKAPTSVQLLGVDEFDQEGRVQILSFDSFVLMNAYFPNSQPERARLDYKLRFCQAIHERSNRLVSEGKNVLICGDYNVAHKAIDLKRPKENENNPGYYIEERTWMDQFVLSGYVDTFRHFHPEEPDHYSWWSYRAGARARNVGWRIDYHCVNQSFLPQVEHAFIEPAVMGSDHCPVVVQLNA